MEIRDEKLRKIAEFLKGTNDAKDIYGSVVNDLLRQEYKADRVEAILNNFIADPNDKHTKDFQDLQAYREECKRVAKEMLGIN